MSLDQIEEATKIFKERKEKNASKGLEIKVYPNVRAFSHPNTFLLLPFLSQERYRREDELSGRKWNSNLNADPSHSLLSSLFSSPSEHTRPFTVLLSEEISQLRRRGSIRKRASRMLSTSSLECSDSPRRFLYPFFSLLFLSSVLTSLS